jgi:hypothetical protein
LLLSSFVFPFFFRLPNQNFIVIFFSLQHSANRILLAFITVEPLAALVEIAAVTLSRSLGPFFFLVVKGPAADATDAPQP